MDLWGQDPAGGDPGAGGGQGTGRGDGPAGGGAGGEGGDVSLLAQGSVRHGLPPGRCLHRRGEVQLRAQRARVDQVLSRRPASICTRAQLLKRPARVEI